jgi:nucleosome assembly protein 1-like 1
VVKKTVPTESFFNFFSPPKAPADDDDDAASDIEERLELDYQLGEDIKEKLIPRAIDWFTGEALQYEELDEELEEGDFEEEDDEEDDDLSEDRDEDDESEEDVSSPKTHLSWLTINKNIGRQHKAKAGSYGMQAKLNHIA